MIEKTTVSILRNILQDRPDDMPVEIIIDGKRKEITELSHNSETLFIHLSD